MNQKILVVDPDPIQRNILDMELSEAGFGVLLAEDGKTGLELFSDHSPMLSIVEVNLPDLPGTHVCDTMKTDPDLPGGLVTLVSAGVQDVTSVADATLRYHSDFYMVKPLQVERLVWKANEMVNGRLIGRVTPDGRQAEAEEGEQAFTTDPMIPVQNGDLAEMSPATLIFSFYVHRRSGSLVIADGSEVRQIVFFEGYPVAADSNVRGEEFGAFAVSIGTCEGSDMVRAKGAWQSIDRPLGVVCVSMGVITARDYYRTLEMYLENVIEGAIKVTKGEYFLEYGNPPTHFEGIGLPSLPPEYILRGIRSGYSDERCLSLLGGEHTSLMAAEGAHFIIRELEDVTYYENVLGSFSRSSRLVDLKANGMMRDGDGQLQTILGLRTIGALWVTGQAAMKSVAQPVARPVDLGFSKTPVATSRKPAITYPEPTPVARRSTPVVPPADKTPVSRGARKPSQPAVTFSDALSTQESAPVATPAPLLKPAQPMPVHGKAAIARVVPRKKMVKAGAAQEKGTPVVDYGSAPSAKPQARRLDVKRMKRAELEPQQPAPARTAEDHFEAGTELFGRGDYKAAVLEFEQAIAKQPGRPVYHVLVAQSILLMPERKEKQLLTAVENLKRAIQLDPRRGDPYYFLGVSLVALGRRQEAQFALRKAVQLRTSHGKEARRLLAEL